MYTLDDRPEHDPDPTLRTLARLRRSTGVDLTFSGTPEGDGLRLTDFDGPVAGPLRQVALNAGHGLGGRILLQQRSMALHDYVSAPSILHTYDAIIRAERLRGMVAAPVIVGRRVQSVIYAASRSSQHELGRLFDAVTAEARALEQTLAVAQALRKRRAPDSADRAQLRESYRELQAIAADVTDAQLQRRIHAVAGRLVSRRRADLVAEAGAASRTPAIHLTGRESDVLTLLGNGHSNAVIAEQLGIGLHTVKGHVKNLLAKLGAANRFEAVVNAREFDLLG